MGPSEKCTWGPLGKIIQNFKMVVAEYWIQCRDPRRPHSLHAHEDGRTQSLWLKKIPQVILIGHLIWEPLWWGTERQIIHSIYPNAMGRTGQQVKGLVRWLCIQGLEVHSRFYWKSSKDTGGERRLSEEQRGSSAENRILPKTDQRKLFGIQGALQTSGIS